MSSHAFFKSLTHDDEKFQNNSTVILEATIADAKKEWNMITEYIINNFLPALQFFHLPPVRNEGSSGDDEANEVTDHDDANHKVKV